MEKTLVLIKPDAVRKRLIGTLIQVYEAHGLSISEMYMTEATVDILSAHYDEHKGQPFYSALIEFMSSGPIVVMALEGENAVEVVREIHGATNPAKARPCTMRYLYGTNVQQNAVHGSATVEDAKRELNIWFQQQEGIMNCD
jgi:nucleoside-diphosphate kinase